MVVIERSVYVSMLEIARGGAPEEVCGLLAGRSTAEPEITRYYEATNVAADPVATYAIDPEEQYRLMEEIDDEGLDLLGFFHTHPAGPARPSGIDRERATWEGHYYLIVSLFGATPVLDAWLWTGTEFARKALRIRA